MLLKVFPGECPIFCLGDSVTFRHLDTGTEGRVVSCTGDEYEVVFPMGTKCYLGNLLRLVNDELATLRATTFRSAMTFRDDVLALGP